MKITIPIIALFIIGLIAVGAMATSGSWNPEKKAEWQEKMAPMKEAIEAGDYEAWKSAVEDLGWDSKLDKINEDNFDIFVAMHQAKQEGDFETAKQLREELGFTGFGKHKRGYGDGQECGWK